jgi:chemotaxis protein MotB
MADQLAPIIIIKKIKKGGHGHHGGAWKVAYADFVTAMMAFFLLMWLLASTTEEQKKGISDYFTPTIGLKDGKGIGVHGGRSAISKGTAKNDLTMPGVVAGQVQQGPVAADPNDVKRPDPKAEEAAQGTKEKDALKKEEDEAAAQSDDGEQFKLAGEEIKQAMSEDPDVKEFSNNIQVNETPEGLKIDLIDDERKPMFASGTATLTEGGKKILDSMVSIVIKTPNALSIIGHTDSGTSTLNPKYSSWELSADRANAARRALVSTQMEPERVVRVIGAADKDLLVKNEPANPRNRRVTLLVMRGVYFQASKNVGGQGFLTLPEVKPKEVAPADLAPQAAPPKPKPSVFDKP